MYSRSSGQVLDIQCVAHMQYIIGMSQRVQGTSTVAPHRPDRPPMTCPHEPSAPAASTWRAGITTPPESSLPTN